MNDLSRRQVLTFLSVGSFAFGVSLLSGCDSGTPEGKAVVPTENPSDNPSMQFGKEANSKAGAKKKS